MRASSAEAGKSMCSVAKQAEIFAEVSTLLVNRTTLEQDVPSIGAALFLAGAIAYLAQKSQLNDIEYLSVPSAIVQISGFITEGEAEPFTDALPPHSTTQVVTSAKIVRDSYSETECQYV